MQTNGRLFVFTAQSKLYLEYPLKSENHYWGKIDEKRLNPRGGFTKFAIFYQVSKVVLPILNLKAQCEIKRST